MKSRFPVIAAVYLMLLRDGKIFMLRRANTGYKDGEYGLPSGHVEAGESLASAMVREAKEEIGIQIDPQDLELVHVRSRNANDGHRLDSFFVLRTWTGEPTNCEAHKCDHVAWFALDALPETTIEYVREVIDHVQAKRLYSEEDWK